MGTISKALGKDCPGQLSRSLGGRIGPGESKQILRVGMEGYSEEWIFEVKDRKMSGGSRNGGQ